jgi:hypothetical protein
MSGSSSMARGELHYSRWIADFSLLFFVASNMAGNASAKQIMEEQS